MKWRLPIIALVLITLFALPGIPEEKADGLLEEKIIRPGETYTVEDYGDLGESNHASLVCVYLFRGQQRTRVYWYAPSDILGKSFCPEQFDSERNVPKEDWTLSLYRDSGTILRSQKTSLEMCFSAGGSYMEDEAGDRFDCGLNCETTTDLSRSILCEKVCNAGGCR